MAQNSVFTVITLRFTIRIDHRYLKLKLSPSPTFHFLWPKSCDKHMRTLLLEIAYLLL